MSVEQIIYITPGESELGELTSMAEYQLKKAATTLFEWETSELPKVFRATENNVISTSDSLLYLANKCRKTSNDSWELIYNNLIKNPADMDEIIHSTRQWKIGIVLWVTQIELKNILDVLQKDWYVVANKNEINHTYNIYAVTIYPKDKKKSDFFKASWWEK